ncbi:tyrosine-type recombinase/integrase [Corynebacterium nasicanis]|uniref:Tyrosine-type recombinase/integrase n=1 Tax=Corynebacterium nasicanis TaxID=1448267 RepID=A0ABW1QDE5_9CORY
MIKASVRASTYATYAAVVNNRVLNDDALCAIPLDHLTVAMVGQWWERTITRWPDTAPRNRSAYQKLRAAVALAVEYGHLDHNVVSLRAARRRVKPKTKDLPDTADMLSILNMVPHRFRLVTVMCLFHGLRVGEALALKGRHIGGNSITVEGNLVRVLDSEGRSTMIHHEPKTPAGYRTVPVLAEFVHVVQEHVSTYQPGADGYATTTAKGDPVMDTVYRNVFHAAQDRAGVTARITPHYGRNWLITRLAEAGATPKEIGRILGQEDVSTIVGVYMRVRESRPAELMGRINPLS